MILYCFIAWCVVCSQSQSDLNIRSLASTGSPSLWWCYSVILRCDSEWPAHSTSLNPVVRSVVPESKNKITKVGNGRVTNKTASECFPLCSCFLTAPFLLKFLHIKLHKHNTRHFLTEVTGEVIAYYFRPATTLPETVSVLKYFP